MKIFIEIFNNIDQTKSTKEKTQYLKEYFEKASSDDSAWTLFFFSGFKFKRLISAKKLFEWCMEELLFPPWILQESYEAVGDLAETIALLMAPRSSPNFSPPPLNLTVDK